MNRESDSARTVKRRIDHLNETGSVVGRDDWERKRLNRLLIDHLLREGCYVTAKKVGTDCYNYDTGSRITHSMSQELSYSQELRDMLVINHLLREGCYVTAKKVDRDGWERDCEFSTDALHSPTLGKGNCPLSLLVRLATTRLTLAQPPSG